MTGIREVFSGSELNGLGYAEGFNSGVSAALSQVNEWVVVAAVAAVVYAVACSLQGSRFDVRVPWLGTTVCNVLMRTGFIVWFAVSVSLAVLVFVDPFTAQVSGTINQVPLREAICGPNTTAGIGGG